MSARYILITLIFWLNAVPALAQVDYVSVNSTSAPTGTVDILVEADTYVPPFYRGRAEPTAGSAVRLIAIPQGMNTDGLSYSWRVNGRAIPGAASVTTVQAPLGSSFLAEVIVSRDGQRIAEKGEVVSLTEPEVLLYEENTLRGRNSTAVGSDYTLIGAEAQLVAIPYFTSRPETLRGSWKIDGQRLELGNEWRTLVLTRPEESRPRYSLELEVTSADGFMARIINRFQLTMGI